LAEASSLEKREVDTRPAPAQRKAVEFVVDLGRHCRVTKGGRVFTYSVTAVVGNGAGTAGLGYGRGTTPAAAAAKALAAAEKASFSIPLAFGRTLADGFSAKQDGVSVVVRPRPLHSGLHANWVLSRYCAAFGITDLSIKSHGNGNPKNVAKAFFSGLWESAVTVRYTREKRGLRSRFV
jgi:small subunit ribosomal protein S5